MSLLEFARPPLTHTSDPLEGWQEVPIQDCGEPLVQLRHSDRVILRPFYAIEGYTAAREELYLRAGLHRCLQDAAAALPNDYELLVLDAWRPTALQDELYLEYREILREESGLEGDALDNLTRRFVSAATVEPPSPHLTGACIDVALAQNGKQIDIGADFDEMSDRSEMDYYERPDIDETETHYRNLRRILKTAMEAAGWVDYPAECWHFSIGDQKGVLAQQYRYGHRVDYAVYGGIRP